MKVNAGQLPLLALLLLCLGATSCTPRQEPDWTWIQVGETDKETVLEWFGEPQDKFINPVGYDKQSPWEYWFYEDGMELGFLDSIVEVLWIPKQLDPLLRNDYTVQQMLKDYGLPEIVYEHYTESVEGIGINGWTFVYPSRGDEFAIKSMFVILPGEPNQPPPPAMEIMSHGRWDSLNSEEWIAMSGEEELSFGRIIRIEHISEYFEKMNSKTPFYEPVAPPTWQQNTSTLLP